MIDKDKALKHHLGNLGRLAGRDVSNKYTYVLSQEDLTNAYMKMRDELGYPLMIDSKYRRAIVYNKKGLEKKIEGMIMESIVASIKEIESIFVEETVKDITLQLNSLVQSANGTITIGKKGSTNSRMNAFVKAMARELVKGVADIIEDITSYDEK